MGFKIKIKAPKIKVPKAVNKALDFVKGTHQAQMNFAQGVASLDGKRALGALKDEAMVAGKSLGFISGQKPEGAPLPEAPEMPQMTNVTQDANEELRQRLGRRFASSALFGMSGRNASTKFASSGLLGF
jgi:hypothetical protein